MSYREIRNFIEKMKVLGYPRIISMNNFKVPNFELVADILYWCIKRYDNTIEITDDISTENNRIEFLTLVAQIMAAKAQIKLKTAQLYRADGFAVRELLKITDILYSAIHATDDKSINISNDHLSNIKLDDFKDSRALTSDIIDSGSKLYTLLSNEEEIKKSRDRAITFLESSTSLETNDSQKFIERSILGSIQDVIDQANEKARLVSELEIEKKNLTAKLAKKQEELERQEKRLKGITQIKPAFQDEYENLERELKSLYDEYVEKFKNLSYLESELTYYHKLGEESKAASEKNLKKMQKKFKEEEMRMFRGEETSNYNSNYASYKGPKAPSNLRDDDDFDLGFGNSRKEPMVVGSMRGGDDEDDDIGSDSNSEDSGTSRPIKYGGDEREGSSGYGNYGSYGQDDNDIQNNDDNDDELYGTTKFNSTVRTFKPQQLQQQPMYGHEENSQSDNDF